ncbi:MAG: type VI secretion protein IcmF/TssM N-terminal domain-containing protein [Phycisphaerales bacterium JB040]
MIKKVFSGLGGLPAPAKIAIVLGVLLALLGALVWAFWMNWKVGLALVVGLVLLVVFLVIVGAVMGAMGKSRAKPFEQELASNAGAAPSGVSAAASRARLDDLRRRFEEGVETFRRHGKDVYSLPWYMIVGEPGSGKTEVIRHSEIGFPPGLQDELQGSGGTINMDWWFTNHAIILDTAGRLLFEEVGSSSTSEWKEFLKLLATHRPNCPVNGLMLVLPADSLIMDSPEEIDAKGGRIARQLDLIQRTLDVRFPVFVLITKADLINGFREFFDELDDPQLAHQMLGWSNQGELDEPFYPEDVAEHFLEIKDRLIRRRGGLLLDPVAREREQRIDEIDAMYTFPESVEQIVPRLKRYLELIFAEGEWATKPLFLRGIYFVSSMREGSALDQDLAEAMGVPLDTLPEGRVWERDRSYFLRDMFLEKMFRERGLVTRASNTNQLKRKRQVALYGFTAVALMVLLLVTFWQASSLRSSIRNPRNFWVAMSESYDGDPRGQTYPVIVGGEETRASHDGLTYLGNETIDSGGGLRRPDGGDLQRAQMPEYLAAQVTRPIRVPLIFKPASWFSSTTDVSRRQEAAEVVLTHALLDPLVRRAATSLNRSNRVGPAEGPVLVELLRVYGAAEAPAPQLGPLFEYVMRDEMLGETSRGDGTKPGARDEAMADLESMQRGFEEIYRNRRGGEWPRSVLELSSPNPVTMLQTEVNRYAEGVARQFGDSAEPVDALGRAMRLRGAMRRFREAEDRLIASYAEGGAGGQSLVSWEAEVGTIIRAASEIGSLSAGYGGGAFDEWFLGTVGDSRTRYEQQIDAMLATLPEATPADQVVGELDDTRRRLFEMRTTLEEARTDLRSMSDALENERRELQALGESIFTPMNVEQLAIRGEAAYAVRARMYAEAEAVRARETRLSRFVDLPRSLGELDDEIAEQRVGNAPLRTVREGTLINDAVLATDRALDRIRARQAGLMFEQASLLPDPPGDLASVEGRVTELAATEEPMTGWELPMLSLDEPGVMRDGYHPRSGPSMIESLGGIEQQLRLARDNTRAEEYRRLRSEYAAEYLEYWAGLIRQGGGMRTGEDWADFRAVLSSLDSPQRVSDLTRTLGELNAQRLEALEGLDLTDDALWNPEFRADRDNAVRAIRDHQQRLRDERALRSWVSSWTALGRNFEAARLNLLNTSVDEFREDFAHLMTDDRHASDFWVDLTVSAVEMIREQGEEITIEACRELEGLRMFPLARLDPNVDLATLQDVSVETGPSRVLSPEELARAGELSRRAMPRASGGGGSYAPGQLGHPDASTGFPRIDEALESIRQSPLPEPWSRQDLEGIQRLLSGLSADPDRPFECTVTLLGPQRRPSGGVTPAHITFPNFRLLSVNERGIETLVGESLTTLDESAIGELRYPGDSLRLEFIYNEGGELRRVGRSVSGAWGPLTLIHRFGAEPVSPDSSVWEVEYTFQHTLDGRPLTYGLWLRLEFEQPLPALDDWGRP